MRILSYETVAGSKENVLSQLSSPVSMACVCVCVCVCVEGWLQFVFLVFVFLVCFFWGGGYPKGRGWPKSWFLGFSRGIGPGARVGALVLGLLAGQDKTVSGIVVAGLILVAYGIRPAFLLVHALCTDLWEGTHLSWLEG